VSCKNTNSEEVVSLSETYKLIVTDTLEVEAVGQFFLPIDYAKDKMLFINYLSPDTVFQVSTKGKIINKFKILGKDPNCIGSSLFGLGYIGENNIAAIGKKGINIYDSTGKLLYKKNLSKNFRAGCGIERKFRIREYFSGADTFLLAQWVPFLDENSFGNLYKDKKIYNQMRFLTHYSFSKNQYTLQIPFEPKSMFITENKDFGDNHLFDFSSKDMKVYSIISPEKILNIYNVTEKGLQIDKQVPLVTKHFELRQVAPFGGEFDGVMNMTVNSEFRALDFSEEENLCLITYKTGIPIEEYKKIDSGSQLPELSKIFNKKYAILLKDGKQISAEFQLPQDAYAVALFKSSSYILLATDSFESPDKTNFYVARLEKVQ
jgi:hypothetical protein